MDLMTMLARQAALAAKCPPATEIPSEDAAKLPIHVERVGTAGPRVLFVHGGVQGGIGGGPATFVRQKTLSENGWRVEIVDRPGFGKSPSRGVDDVEAAVPWIADLIGVGAHVIGHSWGGAASLMAAARRPEAVHSLILVEPALQILAVTDPRIQTDPDLADTVFEMMAEWVKAETPGDFARNFLNTMGQGAAHLQREGGFDDALLTKVGCAMLQGRMPSPMAIRQAAETVAAARIPVLLISGDWSPSIQAVGEVGARATGGRHVIMPSPNHFPQLENPDVFNGIVEAFMREHEPAQAPAG